MNYFFTVSQKCIELLQIPVIERAYMKQQRRTDGTRNGPLHIGARDMVSTWADRQRRGRIEREEAGNQTRILLAAHNEVQINTMDISIDEVCI